MTLSKLENQVKLMRAQVLFLATQQKEHKSIVENIVAYSKKVTKESLPHRRKRLEISHKIRNKRGSALTFHVYSHLLVQARESARIKDFI